MSESVVHFANEFGGCSCRSMVMNPVVTKTACDVTCKHCQHILRPRPSKDQMDRQRRMAGKRAALNPNVQAKFGAPLSPRSL